MLTTYLGEIAALSTAVCWAITSTAFEHSGKRIGSVNLNLIRLLIGFSFLTLFTSITRGQILPTSMSISAWGWLSLSGFVGIVIGDLLLFEAFVVIGARITMLIYASVPPFSGLLAFLFLGENMVSMQIIGMFVTIFGIALVVLVRGEDEAGLKFSHPISGILLAFGGALSQSAGYIIGKYGMADNDPFESTQIRLLAGILSFVVIFSFRKRWKGFFSAIKVKSAMVSVTIGSFFGPFVGISLSLYAAQRINPGVASTLMSLTPVVLIPYTVFFKKEKITLKELAGSFIAITGVALMFL